MRGDTGHHRCCLAAPTLSQRFGESRPASVNLRFSTFGRWPRGRSPPVPAPALFNPHGHHPGPALQDPRIRTVTRRYAHLYWTPCGLAAWRRASDSDLGTPRLQHNMDSRLTATHFPTSPYTGSICTRRRAWPPQIPPPICSYLIKLSPLCVGGLFECLAESRRHVRRRRPELDWSKEASNNFAEWSRYLRTASWVHA